MKIEKFLPLLFVGLLVVTITSSVPKGFATDLTWASVSGESPLYYIPVTLTNNQGSATSTNFQQQITIDSDANTAYYASNLDNVNWQDGAGNILYSWLESGTTNTATASVYWVNLGSRTIAANGGTLTIYEVIYATSINCMNNANTGAEPLYTGTYGQYDDGAAVFSTYDNFARVSLSSMWVNDGMTYAVNNGITMAYTTQSPNEPVGHQTTAGLIYNLNLYNNQNTIAEVDTSYVSSSGAWMLMFLNSNSGTAYGTYYTTYCGDYSNGFNYRTSGTSGGWSEDGSWVTGANTYYIMGIALVGAESCIGYMNYAGTGLYTCYSSPTIYACITPQAYAGNTSTYLTVQWFRIRLYPPNGVMPTVAITGAPISTSTSNFVLYVIIIVAALIVLAIGGFLTLRRREGRRAIPSTKQKVVNIDDVESYLAQGWEYVATLPNDKVIIRLSKEE
jgi:hypothetical protein